MTALPVTEDQIESFKKDPELRKKAYLILKSGDLNSLNDEACHIVGVPPFSYKDVLDLWKTELENCTSSPTPVPSLFASLGIPVASPLVGPKDGSECMPLYSIKTSDLELLGVDLNKIPDISRVQYQIHKQMDLDEIWEQQEPHTEERRENGDHDIVYDHEDPVPTDDIDPDEKRQMVMSTFRETAYRVLKTGDEALLDNHPKDMPFSYREVLDAWKTELESCTDDMQFLDSLGVNYSSEPEYEAPGPTLKAIPSVPRVDYMPDFSLLGLDPKKIPDLSNIRSNNLEKRDLDEIWKQQKTNEDMKNPKLRKTVYRILKTGDKSLLDQHPENMPFSYREVLDAWKTELESSFNDQQFLNSLGVRNFLNPDFSLLGLNLEKLPYPYNIPGSMKSPSKDLDEIWKQQDNLLRESDEITKPDELKMDDVLTTIPKEKIGGNETELNLTKNKEVNNSVKRKMTAKEKALERYQHAKNTPGIVDDILAEGSMNFSGRGSKKRGNVAGVVQNRINMDKESN